MNSSDVKLGMKVKTNESLDNIVITELRIKKEHYDSRQPNMIGIVTMHTVSHGHEFWFIKHDRSEIIGAYISNEFDLVN